MSLDQRDFWEPEPSAFDPNTLLQLRDYQQQARESVAREHSAQRATLVVLPTGAGKSRLAAGVAWDHALVDGRTLILAPSIVLTDQLAAEMRRSGLTVAIERAEQMAQRGNRAQVVVGSVATLKGRRLRGWKHDDFSLIICDEAHRSTSSTYRAILEHFTCAKVMGLTATPDRTDGVALGNVFGSTAYEMTMLDAIERGILCRIDFKTVATDWDPKRLKEVAGEVDPGSVAKELVRSGVIAQAAASLAELSASERTIAFLPTVAAAKAMSVELAARGVQCAHVDGSTPDSQRAAIYQAFRDGKVRVVTNCAVMVEGFDDPGVTCIAILSPTKSRSRLAQMIGRGTRNSPGKTRGLVLDFVPGRLKKGRLASPVDALAGRMLSDDEAAQMPESGDLAEALRSSIERAEQARVLRESREKAQQADRERRAALLAAQALVRQQSAVYSTSEHAAADLLGRAFAKLGAASLESTPEAEDARRRREGLATVKQAAVLQRYGLPANMPRAIADYAMGRITAGGWKLSPADRAEVARRMERHGQPAR